MGSCGVCVSPSLTVPSLPPPIPFQGWRSWGWRAALRAGGRGGTAAAFPHWEGRAPPPAARRWVWVVGVASRWAWPAIGGGIVYFLIPLPPPPPPSYSRGLAAPGGAVAGGCPQGGGCPRPRWRSCSSAWPRVSRRGGCWRRRCWEQWGGGGRVPGRLRGSREGSGGHWGGSGVEREGRWGEGAGKGVGELAEGRMGVAGLEWGLGRGVG